MTSAEASPSPKRRLWPILVTVGLLGAFATAWVTREIATSSSQRLELAFIRDARQRADHVVAAYDRPLKQFSVLQRLFHAAGDVGWPLFRHFVEPVVKHEGVADYGWAPLVTPAGREQFEFDARKLWGESFALREPGADGDPLAAQKRERYFPLFYSLAAEHDRSALGLDLLAPARHLAPISMAIDSNAPAAIALAHTLLERAYGGNLMFLVAPVYRGDAVPESRNARREAVRGLLLMTLDLADIFDSANRSAAEPGLSAQLFDYHDKSNLIARWQPLSLANPMAGRSDGRGFVYKQNFELAGRRLLIQVEAGPEWAGRNESHSGALVPLVGVLLTLALLVYLHRLLGRSALVDALEARQAIDHAERRAAEAWAGKLSLVVEQNPSTIIITDLDGRIEYVNDRFVETTGYAREDALGQHVDMLNPRPLPESFFDQLRETIASGQSWKGDLQTRRRDGTVYWERTLIAPIRDAEGKITNYVSIKEDIAALREVMTRLQESESRFRSAMGVMLEGLVIISPDGDYLFVNRSAQESIGADLLGRRITDLGTEILREDGSPCPPEDYPSHRTLRDGCEIRDAVMGLRVQDGTVHWAEINTAPLHMGDDPRWGVVLTFSDVTERRRTEEQLKLAFEAIKHSGEGILVTNAEHRILSANPAFEAMTGYRTDEIIGAEPSVISLAESGPEQEVALAMREALATSGYWQGEVWNRRRSGEGYPGWLGVSAVQEADNRPMYYIYIFSDITERKEAQKRIEYLAHHDALTGLPNRLLLCDRVAQAQAQAHRMQSRMALMFLDLDRFKTINDSLGHPVGDALLKEVVERLKGCVRESDTISRQGGDEFIILLNDVRDGEAIARVADKIHQRMAAPIVLGSHTLNTSFSIGIAIYPEDGSDFDTLLQKADTAMYHAKEVGRNSHRFFTEQMNQRVVEHLSLETNLRRALENREFVLHYQPQMDLGEGRIIGVEALIRWNSPKHGLVSPARFIPVAEDSGLIVPIGAWVLNEACRQARAWQDAGLPPMVVAVNLSAVQFKRPELVNTVINALVLSDLDSQWLELELTESILIQDAEATLDTVRRLKSLGIKLSVDDFGTGYSSLTYLKRFAVDKLKIDQSFVRDLVADPDDAAIVRAIIQMAHSLKLKTIAEGVETEELANLLRIFHCDEIQGYWLARPMPAEQMEVFLRERASDQFA